MLDIDQLDRVINIQWDRNDIVSIEVAVQNPCCNGISIQTNQEIKECSTVADYDRFFVVFLRENFFREVEGVVSSLIVAEVREVFLNQIVLPYLSLPEDWSC